MLVKGQECVAMGATKEMRDEGAMTAELAGVYAVMRRIVTTTEVVLCRPASGGGGGGGYLHSGASGGAAAKALPAAGRGFDLDRDALADASFEIAEVATAAPAHLATAGGKAGWRFKIEGGEVEVEGGGR